MVGKEWMSYNVRKAVMEDVSAIANLHVNSWAVAYKGLMPESYIARFSYERRHKLWTRMVGEQLAHVFVASHDHDIVGFMCFDDLRGDDTGKIAKVSTLYVCPDFYRKGIGSLLLARCESELVRLDYEKVVLSSLESNESALRFYSSQGYQATGESNSEQLDDYILHEVELAKALLS